MFVAIFNLQVAFGPVTASLLLEGLSHQWLDNLNTKAYFCRAISSS